MPTATLDLLEAAKPIRPDRRALAVSQDRLTEKQFLRDLGLMTAPFAPVSDAASLVRCSGADRHARHPENPPHGV